MILAVVLIHTCEGDINGLAYSFKGIDNPSYYLVVENSTISYLNLSGCGNTLHTSNVAVRRLIIDSLRYSATEMHVDGFRFDLRATRRSPMSG